ncbi:fatty acid desaturase family protein [Hahella sp. KA22]|uniref:fatty acid desaturase family protein n=1 Tax=Hahella sp. KA22 TaxID=1628392 RepID=UPI0013E385C5|nr:fatty acid desaturase family protein [Hahella sp. KA22]
MKLDSYLTRQEQQELRQGSNFRGMMGFVTTWGLIVGVSALFALYPNVFTLILALVVLANRQLALGILLHDCSHRSWFRSQWLNDQLGHWLAGAPVLVPLPFYRKYHFIHHVKTGTDEDPDVGNIRSYPVTKTSMRRKIFRDFTGQSGLKNALALLLYVNTGRPGNAVSMGVQTRHAEKAEVRRTTLRNFSHLLLVHGGFLGLCVGLGHWEVYLLWWVAYIFTYPFIIRVRQVAEHGAMPALSSDDVRDTTRTTLARWWERLLFAPHYVNYHCEHHALPTVPGYNLPRMHQMLRERGFYQDKPEALVVGYPEIIRKAASA